MTFRPPAVKATATAADGPVPYRTWTGSADRMEALTVWTERRPGRGEDAEPLAVHHRPSGSGMVAVFDGSGGSGAAPAWQAPDGVTYTGAWVGARTARLAAEQWFRATAGDGTQERQPRPGQRSRDRTAFRRPEDPGDRCPQTEKQTETQTERQAETRTGTQTGTQTGYGPPGRQAPPADLVDRADPWSADRLAAQLRHTLRGALPRTRSKITGSMRRALPTTLAAVTYRLDSGSLTWRSLWAGDSRAYALLPGTGLHALTRDHTIEDDALAQLRQDPPMTNVICADRPFTVAAHPPGAPGGFPLPCVLLCATDGFFGYVQTPALFEWVLLHALMQAQDMADWAANLCRAVQGYTADDASLSLAALGFSGFPRLRESFRGRYENLRAIHLDIAPPPGERAAGDRDRSALMRRWQEESWLAYAPAYESLMPALPDNPGRRRNPGGPAGPNSPDDPSDPSGPGSPKSQRSQRSSNNPGNRYGAPRPEGSAS